MGRLLGYFQGEKIDSEGQLKAAQTKGRGYSSADNAKARAAGFPSADAMAVYTKNKQTKTGGSVKGQSLNMRDLLAWHPAYTIGMTADAMPSFDER